MDYDIIIVGAAMVGSTAALALANQGFQVLLLDRKPLSNVPSPTSIPVIGTTAVSAGSLKLLDALNTNHDIQNTAQPIVRVHVTQQGTFGSTRIDADDLGVKALGYVVDNATFLARIHQQLQQSLSLTQAIPGRLLSLQQTPDHVTLTTDNATYRSRLLLAVDGANSAVRDLCGINSHVADYEQTAVMATVAMERDHGGTAYERFTPTGPLALLPLANGHASLIMTVRTTDAPLLCALSDDDFLLRVQQDFGYRLGRFTQVHQRQSIPLHLRQASKQRDDRVVLLGNAARLLHPVAGQGFNLALRDIGKLLELLIAARSDISAAENTQLRPGSSSTEYSRASVEGLPDPGADSILSAYVTTRSADQRSTIRLTDTFARGFLGRNRVISHLRGLGLIGVDNVPWLRRGLARRAMGQSAGLPDLHSL